MSDMKQNNGHLGRPIKYDFNKLRLAKLVNGEFVNFIAAPINLRTSLATAASRYKRSQPDDWPYNLRVILQRDKGRVIAVKVRRRLV